ncbi:MAG: sporulation protein YqfD [Clostridia bacterium]|nr:sporulation protein YqfD [Clostridia bacterium]
MSSLGVKWLWGYRKLRCERLHSVRLLNLMMQKGIDYFDLERTEEGEISFLLLEKEYKILMSILDKTDIKVYSVYCRGVPFVIKAHRNRGGLVFGLAIYLTIIFLSSFFIWDIKVVSTTDTPHNVIIKNLEALGCYEGAFVPSIDFENLCIDYVDKYTDFSWVSVNLKGTVAYVEIQEKKLYGEEADTPRNLIASYGGIIEDYSVYEGRSQVETGNVVKRGDLLVSGIVDNKDGDFRLCRAKGEVMATVDAALTVEVPFSYQKQIYTGRCFEEKRIRFFNLTFPYFSDDVPKDINCTSLEEVASAVLFEEIELPLSLEKTAYREYTVKDFVYSEEEAKAAAEALMKRKISKELPNAELISVETSEKTTESSYILTLNIKCRMDITTPAEIETN